MDEVQARIKDTYRLKSKRANITAVQNQGVML
jgi:hypothetical protein